MEEGFSVKTSQSESDSLPTIYHIPKNINEFQHQDGDEFLGFENVIHDTHTYQRFQSIMKNEMINLKTEECLVKHFSNLNLIWFSPGIQNDSEKKSKHGSYRFIIPFNEIFEKFRYVYSMGAVEYNIIKVETILFSNKPVITGIYNEETFELPRINLLNNPVTRFSNNQWEIVNAKNLYIDLCVDEDFETRNFKIDAVSHYKKTNNSNDGFCFTRRKDECERNKSIENVKQNIYDTLEKNGYSDKEVKLKIQFTCPVKHEELQGSIVKEENMVSKRKNYHEKDDGETKTKMKK
jgi:hypothetical protein